MAALDHVSRKQSGHFIGDPRDIPEEFGTREIPEGMVRINHYTSPSAIEGIREHGLLRSAAEESYARGGTEYPAVFATAGPPSEQLLRNRPVVEAYADPSRMGQLDIGADRSPESLEERRSVVTMRGDLPANQVIAIHEPWHAHARYMAHADIGRPVDPVEPYATGSVRSAVARGEHDRLEEDYPEEYGPALRAVKIMNAATVMLGGKL